MRKKVNERRKKREIVTCARKSANGSPLSLANAHVRRDAEARNPKDAHITSTIGIAVMTDVPAWDFVALKKTSMKSYPVGLSKTDISPMQKRNASTIANPRAPFSNIVLIMHQGTIVEALTTSSAIVGWLEDRRGDRKCMLTHMTRAIIACRTVC
jgi:hypothetical protein